MAFPPGVAELPARDLSHSTVAEQSVLGGLLLDNTGRRFGARDEIDIQRTLDIITPAGGIDLPLATSTILKGRPGISMPAKK